MAAAAEARAAAASGEDGGRAGPPGYSAMGGKKGPPPQPGVKEPSSLFILADDNCLRKYTKFIIEWPYPFSNILLKLFYLYIYFHKNKSNLPEARKFQKSNCQKINYKYEFIDK